MVGVIFSVVHTDTSRTTTLGVMKHHIKCIGYIVL